MNMTATPHDALAEVIADVRATGADVHAERHKFAELQWHPPESWYDDLADRLEALPPPAEAAPDGMGYTPGELDRTAPVRIWLQIDTSGDNDERDESWPGAEHVTWQDEQIGGLEIEYVRADLAAPTRHNPEAGGIKRTVYGPEVSAETIMPNGTRVGEAREFFDAAWGEATTGKQGDSTLISWAHHAAGMFELLGKKDDAQKLRSLLAWAQSETEWHVRHMQHPVAAPSGVSDAEAQVAKLRKELADCELDCDTISDHNIELQQRVAALTAAIAAPRTDGGV